MGISCVAMFPNVLYLQEESGSIFSVSCHSVVGDSSKVSLNFFSLNLNWPNQYPRLMVEPNDLKGIFQLRQFCDHSYTLELFIQMLDSHLFLKICFLMKLKPCFKPRWFFALCFSLPWLYAISVCIRKSSQKVQYTVHLPLAFSNYIHAAAESLLLVVILIFAWFLMSWETSFFFYTLMDGAF